MTFYLGIFRSLVLLLFAIAIFVESFDEYGAQQLELLALSIIICFVAANWGPDES